MAYAPLTRQPLLMVALLGGFAGCDSATQTSSTTATTQSTTTTSTTSTGSTSTSTSTPTSTSTSTLTTSTTGTTSTISTEEYELSVLSVNVWRDGTGGYAPWPSATEGLAALIEASGADIVGYQEADSYAPVAALASELGFHYDFQGVGTYEAVLSRYPIVGTFDIPGNIAYGSQGVEIRTGPNQTVILVNAYQHWDYYGPYAVRDDASVSDEQLILESKVNRANHMEFDVLPNLSTYMSEGKPIFITGDFNEPSHLDWTQEAADAGWNYGRSVEWQTSKVLSDAGFVDSYREIVPIDTDDYDSRGETWVKHGIGYNTETEPFDRIDFVHYFGDAVVALDSKIVGEILPTEEQEAHGVTIDIPLSTYPPDHRSVVSSFRMPTRVDDAGMTALTFEGGLSNAVIPTDFGSNVSAPETGIISAGTPNIALTWSAPSGEWQFYYDDEWSAAQMDQYGVGNPFDISFSSDAGWDVTVESFVFDDYAAYKSGNCFEWALYEESVDGPIIGSGVETTTDGQNLTVFTGMTTPHSGTVVLRIVEHDSNVSDSTVDQAIDSIVFRQTPTP